MHRKEENFVLHILNEFYKDGLSYSNREPNQPIVGATNVVRFQVLGARERNIDRTVSNIRK